MRIVKLTDETKNNILEDLLKRSPNSYGKFEAAVNDILLNVRTNKDEALFKYTKDFDKADINASNIVVTKEEIEEAYTKVDPALVDVIRKSLKNIIPRRKRYDNLFVYIVCLVMRPTVIVVNVVGTFRIPRMFRTKLFKALQDVVLESRKQMS